ncbi:MAG: hypothetical protein AB7Q81_12845 [Gammaproteobacteria bacterium]
MTAEIAILNKSGIALAADSAVTIGDQKVYNSANKLFALSKYQPVGIMVYDSADFMGIPWELIIKEYRHQLGTKTFATLDQYVEDFWTYLSADEYIIPQTSKDDYFEALVHMLFGALYESLETLVKARIESGSTVTIASTLPLFRDALDGTGEIVNSADYLPGFNEQDVVELAITQRSKILEMTFERFGELSPLLSSDDQDEICRQAAALVVKDKFLLRASGVVIAGFGDKDMFPKIASYLVEGMVDGRIKKAFILGKSTIHQDEFLTTIVPFAQDEMVWTFLAGVDPDISSFAGTYLEGVFDQYASSLDSESTGLQNGELERLRDRMQSDGAKLLEKFREDLYQFQQKNNTQPILDMVGVLPKDELAAMAESLVNLTVFKRKISRAVETVGGPIDVAVISKGDGFIWIKRKHYFKPEYNPQFFANYYRE